MLYYINWEVIKKRQKKEQIQYSHHSGLNKTHHKTNTTYKSCFKNTETEQTINYNVHTIYLKLKYNTYTKPTRTESVPRFVSKLP